MTGNDPRELLFVIAPPEVYSPSAQRELQHYLNALAGNFGQKVNIIVLPPGSRVERPFKEDRGLANIGLAIYGCAVAQMTQELHQITL